MSGSSLRAVVTGAAGGIGTAVCDILRERGNHVFGVDVRPSGGVASFDLSQPSSRAAVIASACDEMGGIDLLVNVAGVFVPTPASLPDVDAWRAVWAVNLEAPIELMARAAPLMRTQGFGRIVNITSIHASVAEKDCLAYDVGKAGLTAATRSLALDFARANVLVNAVAPGFVRTPMSTQPDGRDESDSEAFRSRYVDGGLLPVGRSAEPAEIAAAVAWLGSRDNTYVTGQTLVADGGLTITF